MAAWARRGRRCRSTSRAASGRRVAFDATLSLRRQPLTAAGLRRATRSATLRVLALIYGHALALKLKGVPVHPQPERGGVSAAARAIVPWAAGTDALRAAHDRRGRPTVTVGDGEPQATRAGQLAARVAALLHGSRGLAEAYADGLWDSPDLTAVDPRRRPQRSRRSTEWRRRAGARARAAPARCAASAAQHRARAAAATSPPTTTSATTCSS